MSESTAGRRQEADPRLSDKEEVSCKAAPGGGEAMICERCGKAEMYRMHAVRRVATATRLASAGWANRYCGSPCPECGFKTDCCGW